MKLDDLERKIFELQSLRQEAADLIRTHVREVHAEALWKERGSRNLQDYCKTHLRLSHFETRDLLGEIGVILTSDKIASDDPSIQSRIEKLKVWRRQRCKDDGVAAFRVFSNRTLLAVAQENPQTAEDLLKISGLGPRRVAHFGDDLLRSLKPTV